jgi:hypothetical protein
MSRRLTLGSTPRALHSAKLDNIALVPGNLLPFKASWQPVANQLPPGSVLIYLPPPDSPSRRIAERIALHLGTSGNTVIAIPAPKLGQPLDKRSI